MQARDFLLWLCQELGIRVNLMKSSLTPSQTIDYLGMRLQTCPFRVFPAPKRVLNLSSLIHYFSSFPLQPIPMWRQLLVVMSSMSPLVPGSRLRMRSLQLRLNVGARFLTDSEAVSWDDSYLEDLRWWSVASHLTVGHPLGIPQPDLSLFTDASDNGWGASLGDDHLSGLWNRDCSSYSINHRELLAVLYSVQGLLHLLHGRSVSLYVDNTTALSYICKQGGTHSPALNAVAQAILRLCGSHQIRLLPQFIPGRLNVLADSLSHRSQVLGSEWTLCRQAFREVLHCWPATVSLFATNLNHRLPIYFSPMPDPQSAGTDAMLQSWDGFQAYAFPPSRLLQRVLSKVRQSRGLELTLGAPFWLQHPWFPDLLELLVDLPFFLKWQKDLLRQLHFHRFPQNLPMLRLTAYCLSSNLRATSDTLRQWLVNLPTADNLPPL